MPIIKSAKKKLRQDKKRKKQNLTYIEGYKQAIKKLKKASAPDKINQLVKQAYSRLDKAVKKNIIHKNKAARLKSGVAKFLKAKKSQKIKK